LKVSIFIFVLGMLMAGSVVGHENDSSSATAAAVSITHQGHQIFERTIDERIIDRLGLLDRSDQGSGRYSVSLNVEKEGSDWNFEVTVTVDF